MAPEMATMTFAAWVHAQLVARAADRAAEGSPAAGVYQRVADDVLRWEQEYQHTPLALALAVQLSGYSEQGLRRILRQRGAAHFTRATLPIKPDVEPVTVEGAPVALRVLVPEGPRARRRPRRAADPLVSAVFGSDL